MGLTTFAETSPLYEKPLSPKNYLNEKELRAMGQLVSGYLDFAERQAEREQPMTMQDWANHLDRILTMSGEQLLIGNGSVTHKQAVDKATTEYRKYKAKTLSDVEQDYLDSIKFWSRKQTTNNHFVRFLCHRKRHRFTFTPVFLRPCRSMAIRWMHRKLA